MPDTPSIIIEAQKRFKLCKEAEEDGRTLSLDDLNFRKGDQWPEKIKRDRNLDGRPCLTLNLLASREKQILNEQRQNRPAIHVHPVDDKADPDTANIIQGMVRHIEYDSNADAAYDTATASAVRIGFGYVRVLTEYEDPLSFDQVIKIGRIVNPFQVYLDPSYVEADASDAEFGFIFTALTRDEYKELYPDSEASGLDSWASVGDKDPEWLSENSIRVAEYFYKDTEADTLYLVRNRAGEERTLLKSQLKGSIPKGVKILDKRETQTQVVKWCKFNAVEVLEEREWPGKWIPIVPVLGDELYVDGKRILEGMVRHTKDAIRMSNYMASAEVEAIALAPRAPWIGAEGQFENHESQWRDANTRNFAYLEYKPQDVGGKPVGPPQRNTQEPAIAAITQARIQFDQSFKDITGIYDAQVGAKSNETSGTAIASRKIQGQIANYHYTDNLTRAIRHLGRQIVDLIPKIYSTKRVMRIIGEDGEQKTVTINARNDSGKVYDVTVGRYDVTVQAGPSFTTKRQEAVQSMLDLAKVFPPIMQVAGDLLINNLDVPGAKEMAERAKFLLPPQLQQVKEGDDPKAIAARTQVQLQALSQQHEQLVQQLNAATDVINNKKLELESKENIVRLQEQTKLQLAQIDREIKLAVAEIQTKAQDARVRAQMEQDTWSDIHSASHELGLQANEQAHELAMSQFQGEPNGEEQPNEVNA